MHSDKADLLRKIWYVVGYGRIWFSFNQMNITSEF